MKQARSDNIRDELRQTMERLSKLAASAGRRDAGRFGSYHNHTTWSDGVYSPDELVNRAIAIGFSEIGITDHAYTRKGGIHCVHDSQIDDYHAALDHLRQCYKPQIRVLIGLEIDTSSSNPNRFTLPVHKLARLDYVLFEYVGEHARGGMLLQEFLSIRREIRCPVGLAHPDMPALIAKYGAQSLAETLVANNVFIDACGSDRNSRSVSYERSGLSRNFTLNIEALGDEFKAAARSCGLQFIPSSDTHRDDERDALAATVNAIATIVRYDLPQVRLRPRGFP